jgi:hypothetical protein
VAIEGIMEALGHTSETQTRRYCGLTVNDMTRMHLGVSQLLDNARSKRLLTQTSPALPSIRISR